MCLGLLKAVAFRPVFELVMRDWRLEANVRFSATARLCARSWLRSATSKLHQRRDCHYEHHKIMIG